MSLGRRILMKWYQSPPVGMWAVSQNIAKFLATFCENIFHLTTFTLSIIPLIFYTCMSNGINCVCFKCFQDQTYHIKILTFTYFVSIGVSLRKCFVKQPCSWDDVVWDQLLFPEVEVSCLTHWPLGDVGVILTCSLWIHVTYQVHQYFLWNCFQVSATEHLWW